MRSSSSTPITRLKVFFAIPTLARGGAERVFANLVRHLDPERIDASLVLFSDCGAAFLDVIPPHVRVISLNAPQVRDGLARFVRLLWSDRPDVVLSTLEHLNIALAATRPFWPRSTRHIVRITHVIHLQNAGYRRAMRLLYRFADGVVYQSDEMQKVMERGMRLRHPRTFALNNPIDVQAVRSRMRTEAPSSRVPNRVNLVAVGTLEPRKGFDLLLTAISDLHPGVHVKVVGEGHQRGELQELAKTLHLEERVEFVGQQPNPYPFLFQADAFVLSSRSEGFPNVLLEALACGTPAVAMPLPGVAPLLHRIPGCIVCPEVSASGLTNGLRQLLASPMTRVPEDAVQSYDVRLVAARYASAIQAVAGR
jgi:glycosyltransferase involved in cell wall biosynthesis